MRSDENSGARIQILPPNLAQKIAAGEVIERPQSVLRELLDNCIDAGARNIEVRLIEGGLEEILVVDDGSGMSAENLSLCWLPHATSKIHTEDDLYDIRTLGFRGEALASISAVSHLEISTFDGHEGGKLVLSEGKVISQSGFSGKRGTRVSVSRLFYNLPGRKQFLKRAATEFSQCKTVFVDKALAHPHIAFRLFNNQELAIFADARDDREAQKKRYFELYRNVLQNQDLLHTISFSYPDGKASAVLAGPALYQNDRRHVQIFINRRRIQDFSLVQAVEYGYTGFLPGGRFPVAAVFLDVDPARVDVNIHPAKREVRLKDSGAIHHSLVSAVQSFLRNASHAATRAVAEQRQTNLIPEAWLARTERPLTGERNPNTPYVFPPAGSLESNTSVREQTKNTYGNAGLDEQHTGVPPSEDRAAPQQDLKQTPVFEYLGQVFGVFLIVKLGNELQLMDMHAAHERIIFDALVADTTRQPLLVPFEFQTDDDRIDRTLAEHLQPLAEMGIVIQREKDTWLLTEVPRSCASDLSSLVFWLTSMPQHREGIVRSLYATMSCRAAIKDGDHIDPSHARELIEKALQLPEKRCPHGRPIAFTLSKNELFELVGRLV